MEHLLSTRGAAHTETTTTSTTTTAATESASATSTASARSSFTDTEVVGNVKTFIIAGSDTVGGTLAWALYHIAKYPAVQAKLYAELIASQTGADGAVATDYTWDQVSSAVHSIQLVMCVYWSMCKRWYHLTDIVS
jgi:cytochrome P450